ncbi:MAG: 2-amino-4-hydroxy-6-hydroxymethyldihydropteridine diphosphokinase [Muribaculaceae bacterium]|nr:2-amino-4-hydroxy-6-hydroxymethyldihydropteridine diphosphokinase [Muribaculaceae bacterium]
MTVLCLGSNAPDGEAKISEAMRMLQAKGCRVLASSPIYPSSHGYLNQVVAIDPGQYDRAVLTALTKWVERRLGRRPEMKSAGQVPIDIDIVILRGQTLRPADFASPYFRQGYSSINQ